MSKKQISRVFVFVGIATLVVPIIVSFFFPMSLIKAMRLIHIPLPSGFDNEWWLYISAFFLSCAGLLQFPFKEEEGWTCECGYDWSYVDTKSKKCPECGETMQVEWTSTSGEFSRQTKRRIRYAIILFAIAALIIAFCLYHELLGYGRPRW